MSEIKISVIIPVYNVAEYLQECVDSVLNQTYRNLEVILVDDGSTDACPAICDAYAEADHRVTVIHKKNGGLSDARNAGVGISSGEYGIFLDSDDYWSDQTGIEKLAGRLQKTNAEVLSFAYYKFEEETGTRIDAFHAATDMPLNLEDKLAQLEYLTDQSLYIASACNKLIKMRLLKLLPFEKGKVSEDVEWCAKLMEMAESFDFLALDFYCYRQRSGSISQSLSMRSCVNLKEAIIGCAEIVNRSAAETKPYTGRYAAYQFSTFIAVQAFVKEHPVHCIRELKSYKDILRFYGNSNKVKYMYYGVRIFGLRLWCRLIKITMPIWNKRREKI